MQDPIFFDSWAGIGRILMTGVLAYAVLIVMLRISGKRTLSKFNAFDFIVTICLGSMLSSIIITKWVPLMEGVVALALLIGLQFAITWMSVRSSAFKNLIQAEPTLLLHKGEILQVAMRRQRMTRDDLLAAIRAGGSGDLSEIDAVTLETDVSLSVVRNVPRTGSSLSNIDDPSRVAEERAK